MDSETTAMMAKEDRKLNEWNRIVDARKADVASWSRERSKIEAAKFVSDYQHETVFVGHNGFYARVDMLRDVEANSLYMEAVKEAAPKIFNKAMIEMVQRLQNKEFSITGIPKPAHEVEVEKQERLHASQLTPEKFRDYANSHIEHLFSPTSAIGDKLRVIQIYIETSPIYKAEVAKILPEIISVAKNNKEEYLRRHATLSNTASTPYQDGKLKVNLSHAKDLKAPESRSIKR